jgi:hypothetical protein
MVHLSLSQIVLVYVKTWFLRPVSMESFTVPVSKM